MSNNLNPIFISGLYRSGTTTLAEIIDSVDGINVSVGSTHFMRLIEKFNPIEKNLQKALIFMSNEYRRKWKKNININVNSFLKEKKSDLASIYDKLIRELLNIGVNYRWAEKTNVQWESIPKFLSIFPKGQVVHIYRDPRSVAASFKFFTRNKYPMFLDSVFASKAMFKYLEKNKLFLNNKKIKIIKFENFFSKQNQSINDLFKFLKVNNLNKDSKINLGGKNFPYKNSSSFHYNRRKKKLHFDNSEKILSNAELYFIQKYLKSEIKKFGYKDLFIKMSKSDLIEFEKLCDNVYLKPRIKYVSKFNNGKQGFPEDTKNYT